MAEVLRFEKASTRLRIQKWGGQDCQLLASCDVRADSAKRTDREVRLAAIELSNKGTVTITKEQLWEHINAFETLSTNPIPIYPNGLPPKPPFRLRLLASETSESFSDFESALSASSSPHQVIEWDSADICSAVDLDFHDGDAPLGLDVLASSLRPMPWRWWITRSKGLRCIYLGTDRLPAHALAGVAAFELLQHHPYAGLELLTRTRVPPEGTPNGGSYAHKVQDDGADAIRRLQGQYNSADPEYAGWLEVRGWQLHGRYPHSECPANPHPRAAGNTQPVVVHDDHVYCFVCAADGVTHGSHTPGYFPAARLCGGYHKSLFALCVDKLTHWEHAKHVLESVPALSGRGPVAKSIYFAALACKFGRADPRIGKVFTAGDNLVRYDGHWADDQGRPVVFREERPQRLYELPAVLYVQEGVCEPDRKIAEWLKHTGDVSRYGYPAIIPIYGIHLSSRIAPEGWKVFSVVSSQVLRQETMRDRRPRYLPPRARMPEEDAWKELELVFPGINRRFVELLIASKGCAETGAGMPPMMFVSGPTGAGKSATVKIAAAMVGDHVTEIPYSSNAERLRAGLLAAKKKGTFACFDEFLKGAGRERKDPATGMEALLNFTPDSESHVLYVGPVPLGALPVCIWCDTAIPKEVVEHAQIARRLAWVKLPTRMRWDHSMVASSLSGPESLRVQGSRRLLDACDSLLSTIVDRRLSQSPLFSTLVRDLGFLMLEDVDVAKEKEAVIRAFYKAVSDESPYSGPRVTGEGWKQVDRNRDGYQLTDLWNTLADASGIASRALDETDIAAVCKLRKPARFESRHFGQYVFVRFAADDGCGEYNGDLYEVELPTK